MPCQHILHISFDFIELDFRPFMFLVWRIFFTSMVLMLQYGPMNTVMKDFCLCITNKSCQVITFLSYIQLSEMQSLIKMVIHIKYPSRGLFCIVSFPAKNLSNPHVFQPNNICTPRRIIPENFGGYREKTSKTHTD